MIESAALWLLLVPAVGALLVALLPAREATLARGFTLVVSLVELALGAAVYSGLDPAVAGPQLAQTRAWIEPLGLGLEVAVDGLSSWPIALTVLVVPLALFGGWDQVRAHGRDLCVPLLLFESGALAVFLAADLGLLLAGWELVAFAAWTLRMTGAGAEERRAATRGLIGAQLGAGALLIAFLMLGVAHYNATPGEWSLSFAALSRVLPSAGQQQIGFCLVVVAVVFTVPVFPVHAWAVSLGCGRNPVVSAVLGAVLIELGVHVLRRHGLALFPIGAADLGPVVGWLALAGVVHSGLAARVERRLGALIGYLMVAGAGIEVIGVLSRHPDAWSGVALFGVGRGLGGLAALLVIAGIRARTGHEQVDRVRGLGRRSPLAAALLLVALLALLAAPGFAGFGGLVTVLAASFRAHSLASSEFVLVTGLAAVALVLAAGAVLGRWQGMVAAADPVGSGPLLSRRIVVAAVIALSVCIGLGVSPQTLVRRGTWTAREQAGQLRERLCVARAARDLGRERRFDAIGPVGCTDAPASSPAGETPP